MDGQFESNYQRIAKAIEYIQANFKAQPSLEQIAEAIHLSPFHFQRLFKEWAGISPKKFMQFISLNYAKQLIQKEQATLFSVAEKSGLSSTGRLHDLFVSIEGMTPGEYKNGGQNLNINFSFQPSPFGQVVIASTEKGICYIAFSEDQKMALAYLKQQFPKANYQEQVEAIHIQSLSIFNPSEQNIEQLKLHLKGTAFQLKVWEALLQIPEGQLSTYGKLAGALENPKASRAVGTAIGQNPVAYLIPCHRVIQTSGKLGGYMWGSTRKQAIIAWEASQQNFNSDD